MDPSTWLIAIRHHSMIYHNHKEQIAYLATALYLAAATGIATHDDLKRQLHSWLGLFGAVIAVVGIQFVHWQLGNRRFASEIVTACDDVGVRWLIDTPTEEDLQLVSPPSNVIGNPLPRALAEARLRAKQLPRSATPWLVEQITYWTMAAFAGWAGLQVWLVETPLQSYPIWIMTK